jgi:hypothetical protein
MIFFLKNLLYRIFNKKGLAVSHSRCCEVKDIKALIEIQKFQIEEIRKVFNE